MESQGAELSVDALDDSGGQFLTPDWLYGQTGRRGGHGEGPKKPITHEQCLRKQTRTATTLSFVEWRYIKGKEEEHSFNPVYWKPTEHE